MTFIKAFTITGLAGRPDVVSKPLDRYTNIFWGLNGTGKTTLLRLLEAALDNTTENLHSLAFETAEVVFHSEDHDIDIVRRFSKSEAPGPTPREPNLFDLAASAEINEELVKQRDDSDSESNEKWHSEFVTQGKKKIPKKVLDVPFRNKYLPISRVTNPFQSYPEWEELEPDRKFAWHVNNVWADYSARTSETIRGIQQLGMAEVLGILFGGFHEGSARDKRIATRGQNATAHEAHELVQRFLAGQDLYLALGEEDFTSRYEQSPDYQHVVERIREVLGEVDQVLEPQRALQEVVGALYRGNKKIILGTGRRFTSQIAIEFGDNKIPVSSLSSGEKQLLQILLETLSAEQAAVMIDEPELSMHVHWQSQLIDSMRRVNTTSQFILATHSPDLMVGVNPELIHEL